MQGDGFNLWVTPEDGCFSSLKQKGGEGEDGELI